jgi:hypothetical protein
MLVVQKISATGKLCVIHSSTGYQCIALTTIIVTTILSERQLSVDCLRSPAVCGVLILFTSLPCAMLGNATLLLMRSKPVVLPFVHAAYAL